MKIFRVTIGDKIYEVTGAVDAVNAVRAVAAINNATIKIMLDALRKNEYAIRKEVRVRRYAKALTHVKTAAQTIKNIEKAVTSKIPKTNLKPTEDK